MGKACCVWACSSGVNVPSHKFPRDKAKFERWKTAVASPNTGNFTNDQFKRAAVCYKHFKENDYFETYAQRRLKPDVVPSLNLYQHIENPIEIQSNEGFIEPIIGFHEDQPVQRHEPIESRQHETLANQHLQDSHQVPVNHYSHETIESYIVSQDAAGGDLVESENKTVNTVSDGGRLLLPGWKLSEFSPKSTHLYLQAQKFKKRCQGLKRRRLTQKRRSEVEKYKRTPVIRRLWSRLSEAQQNFINMQFKGVNYKPQVCWTILRDWATKVAIQKLRKND